VDTFAAPDDYTVVIRLKAPDANFLHQVASYHQGQVLKKEALEKYGDQYQLNPIGTGPFMMDHFTQNSEIVLTASDGYFRGPAQVKRVTYRIIKDDATAEVALKNHEVDLVGQMADNGALGRLKSDQRLTFFTKPAYAVSLTMFNTTFEPFSKPQCGKHSPTRSIVMRSFSRSARSRRATLTISCRIGWTWPRRTSRPIV